MPNLETELGALGTIPIPVPIPIQPTPLASGADAWSGALAMVMGLAFLGALAVIILFNRWNRPDMDSDHAAHILAQLDTFGGTRGGSVVVRAMAALEDPEVIANVRGLFHGERSDEPRASAETTRAVREVVREVRAELGARTPEVSTVPARALYEAALTALLGALAIVPLAVWRSATETGGGPSLTLGDVVAGASTLMDLLIGAITLFPYSQNLFALGLTVGIIGANTIWTLWMVPPVVLAALAVTYWWLERRVDTERPVSGPSIRAWTTRFLTLGLTVWTTGAALAVLGGLIPLPGVRAALALIATAGTIAGYAYLTHDPEPEDAASEDASEELETEPNPGRSMTSDPVDPFGPAPEDEPGDEPERDADSGRSLGLFRGVNWIRAAFVGILTLGFAHSLMALIAAVAVAVVVAVLWTRRTLARWRTAAVIHGRDALALDIIHSLTVTVGALTLPLMVGYGIAAIGTGKAFRVAVVVLSAPPTTVYALAALAAVTAFAAVFTFADRFGDARRGLERALSVQSVRAVILARAFPALTAFVVAVLGLGLGLNPVMVVAVALAAGVVVRVVWMAYNYVSFRARTRPTRSPSASRVVISGRQVTDADGDPVFIASVNGHRTAHRRLDPLIQQIRRDTRGLLRDGTPETGSFARYYYKNGVLRGKVDMDAVADELLGDVRTRFKANVKQTDASAPDILAKLNREYPPHAVQWVVTDAKEHGRVTRREDRFQWLG